MAKTVITGDLTDPGPDVSFLSLDITRASSDGQAYLGSYIKPVAKPTFTCDLSQQLNSAPGPASEVWKKAFLCDGLDGYILSGVFSASECDILIKR